MKSSSKEDRLRALEYVEEFIAMYVAEGASAGDRFASLSMSPQHDAERGSLSRYIDGNSICVERLRHVRRVVLDSLSPRRSSVKRRDTGQVTGRRQAL